MNYLVLTPLAKLDRFLDHRDHPLRDHPVDNSWPRGQILTANQIAEPGEGQAAAIQQLIDAGSITTMDTWIGGVYVRPNP